MGLDQYLFIVINDEIDEGIHKNLGTLDPEENVYDTEDDLEQIMYLRKENWFHKFMDSEAEAKGYHEIGNCEYFVFNRNLLARLYSTINIILEKGDEDTALKLLPPCSGFFFGSTEINEDYFDSLEYVRDNIKKYLDKNQLFAYYAWW